jgi:hypothetical protein
MQVLEESDNVFLELGDRQRDGILGGKIGVDLPRYPI